MAIHLVSWPKKSRSAIQRLPPKDGAELSLLGMVVSARITVIPALAASRAA
jgi:hypothetical protein